MAKFPIQRAPERLGATPTTAVLANLDVDTGEGQVARAVEEFGGAVFDVGRRHYIIEAD